MNVEPQSQLHSSIEEPPSEHKPLSEHLNYAYLDANETLFVIIAADLTKSQKEALLSVLRGNREVIGLTMIDIKEISPTIIQHRIDLIEEAKPVRDPQHMLNPVMKYKQLEKTY